MGGKPPRADFWVNLIEWMSPNNWNVSNGNVNAMNVNSDGNLNNNNLNNSNGVIPDSYYK